MSLVFKVGYEEVVGALKKAAIGGNVNYCIMTDPSKKDDKGNCKFLVSASAADEENANAMSLIEFYAAVESADGASKFVVGSDFSKVVLTMAQLKKELTITYDEPNVVIACDGAQAHVPTKTEFKTLAINKSEKMVGVIIETEQLKLAVSKGATFTPTSDTVLAKGSVQCKVCMDEEKPVLRVLSTDFVKGTYCQVPVAKAAYVSESAGEFVSENFSLKASMIDFVVNNLDGKMTQILFGESVAQISCGDASYTVTLVAKKYTAQIEKVFLERYESVRIKMSKKDFTTAMNLASLTNSDKYPVCISVCDGFVEVKDYHKKSQMRVDAEIEGSVDGDIGINYKDFKVVLNNLVSEEITIATDTLKPIYFFDSTQNSVAFSLPINLDDIKEE